MNSPRVAALRYFRLPETASAEQLRQAYLVRAKQVHPDVAKKVTTDDFQELQERFKEASCFISQRGKAPKFAQHPPYRPLDYEWVKPDNRNHSKTAGAGYATAGFSPSLSYPLALVLGAAASTWLWLPRERSPPRASEIVSHKAPGNRTVAKASVEPQVWPPLKSGPWHVAQAKATPSSIGQWTPSRSGAFVESDDFYANRAKGHIRAGQGQRSRLGEKQNPAIKELGYDETHTPVMRNGVEMLPAHIAAGEGRIWWLERCGADPACRGTLGAKDTSGETPLFHAARSGQEVACYALLRLGVDATAVDAPALPEDLARSAGLESLAESLHQACVQPRQGHVVAALHVDGLGLLEAPPEGVVFSGLGISGALTRAVNMSAGVQVVAPLPITPSMYKESCQANKVVQMIRGSLCSTEFDLEELDVQSDGVWAAPNGGKDFETCGLLVYETAGQVSADAPGHWVAIRRAPPLPSAEAEGSADRPSEYFRLDPVRGPFRLSEDELLSLLRRFSAWRTVRGPAALREQRNAKLSQAKNEAQKLMKH